MRALLLGFTLVLAASTARATPMFMGLGDLAGGAVASGASAISGDGSTVVGTGTSASGSEAFVWTAAQGIQGLGDLPGGSFASVANDVSRDGSIVVGAGQGSSGSEAFRWTEADGLQSLGGGAYTATAITRDGTTIVGGVSEGSGAFRWTAAGGIQVLSPVGFPPSDVTPGVPTDVSDNGAVIVGFTPFSGTGCGSSPDAIYCGWRWQSHTGFQHADLPGMGRIHATSANSLVVVGTFALHGTLDPEAAAWFGIGAGGEGIGSIPGTFLFNSAALDVNALGLVAVGYSTDFEESKAFVWDPIRGTRDLQQELEGLGLDLTGWSLTAATAVSDDGLTIAGNGINPSGMPEAWLATIFVPEPSTAVLLGLGLTLFAGWRCR